MRSFKLAGFLALSLTLTTTAFANTEMNSQYKIVYQSSNIQWKLENQQLDPDGYSIQYQPSNANKIFQSLTLNYGKNIQTSLKDSMQQVISEMNTTDCERKESNILKQDQNTLVFATVLDKCQNGKSLQQIFKVFNMPDGQYSIVYSTDSIADAQKSLATMETMIESAKLIPSHA